MRIASWSFPDELLYDEHHQWVRREGDRVAVGLSDFGQYSRGDVLYVQLPTVGRKISAGEAAASIETGKWVGRIYAPCAGVVAAVNRTLETDPGLINRFPYGGGWILEIGAATLATEGLMSGARFRTWLGKEIAKYRLPEDSPGSSG